MMVGMWMSVEPRTKRSIGRTLRTRIPSCRRGIRISLTSGVVRGCVSERTESRCCGLEILSFRKSCQFCNVTVKLPQWEILRTTDTNRKDIWSPTKTWTGRTDGTVVIRGVPGVVTVPWVTYPVYPTSPSLPSDPRFVIQRNTPVCRQKPRTVKWKYFIITLSSRPQNS